MKRHLVLVGLPGSGKSTIGALVAAQLGVGFTDLDHQIAALAGSPVAEIFTTRGEAAFRELEREAMDAALLGDAQVIAPGGGWAAQPGNLAAVGARALVIYLAISPEAAADRLKGDTTRPLLAGVVQPREMLEQLLLAREPFYRLAAVEVDAESGPPEFVAKAVVAAARGHGVPAPGLRRGSAGSG